MRIPRLFVEITLSLKETVTLSREKAHHIMHVLRMRTGEQITLFNNTGVEYKSRIIEITKKHTQLEVLESQQVENESPLSISLCLAIARSQHMDFSIQKAVELGVKNIIPLISEYSNVKIQRGREQNKMAHWQNIIISATEQSGRCRLTELKEPLLFDEWLMEEAFSERLILHPGSNKSLPAVKLKNSEVTLMIGPEGGFSEQEVEQAEEQGCTPVSLGPRILRTETAVVSAVSNAQQLWGDLN